MRLFAIFAVKVKIYATNHELRQISNYSMVLKEAKFSKLAHKTILVLLKTCPWAMLIYYSSKWVKTKI